MVRLTRPNTHQDVQPPMETLCHPCKQGDCPLRAHFDALWLYLQSHVQGGVGMNGSSGLNGSSGNRATLALPLRKGSEIRLITLSPFLRRSRLLHLLDK